MKIYKLRNLVILGILNFFVLASFVQLFSSPVSALSGNSFIPGKIIDDSVFFNRNSMTSSQIQAFLNSKVPSCDSNGTKPYGSTTRKAYAASKGVRTPFICLKSYKQNTPAKPTEASLCSAMSAKSNRSAAQMIYDVSRSCNVSSKVLLVLLQKEQSLVTDDWPWPIQYRSATGFGCPDTAPCDSDYYGFFNQVYHAARQYKRYARDASSFNYRKGFTNYIQWHPRTSCGGSNVYIQNQATAGLYNYTPYRPNQAALNNLYGEGNSCSSYGNRNFWRMYNDWFGKTIVGCTSSDRRGVEIYRLYSHSTGLRFWTGFECEAYSMIATNPSWRLEGTAFKQAEGHSDSTRIYRLKKQGKRFYTSSNREKDILSRRHGWTYEGVAFYGLGNNSSASKTNVFRLYNRSTGVHFWTSSVGERDGIKNSPRWRYEGTAFYVPL